MFVINLDDSVDRLSSMSKQFDNLSLDFERISAVKGGDLSQDELNRHYSISKNRVHYRTDLTLGEIGCYMSHRKTWQKMLDEKVDYAFIFEDDSVIDKKFLALLELIDTLEKYNIVKLDNGRNLPAKKEKSISKEFGIASYAKMPNCTTGYGVSKEGAAKLLARNRFYRPVDIDLQFFHELELSVVGILPSLVSVNQNFTSDIATLNGGHHRNKSGFLRNIKFRTQLVWQRKFRVSANLF